MANFSVFSKACAAMFHLRNLKNNVIKIISYFLKNFSFPSLKFRSMIYLELIFVSGMKDSSRFILLNVDVQLQYCLFNKQYCLLKRPSFPQTELQWYLCHVTVDCMCMGVFPYLLFCSIVLVLYIVLVTFDL